MVPVIRGLVTAGCLLLAGAALAVEPEPTPAPGQEQEYVSTAPTRTALKDPLFAMPGKEAHVIEVTLPAGWVGPRHYHTGDVFVYVAAGQFTVDVDGEGRKVFEAGEVYHEARNTNMQARNQSATVETKLILFQVGDVGEPLMMMAPAHAGHDG